MVNIPKVAQAGTNLLVRVQDVNRQPVKDVLIEVVGLRGSVDPTVDPARPGTGVRFPGEKTWGFENIEFNGATSMSIVIRAFKPDSDFGPIPDGDVPDWSKFAPGAATVVIELVKGQDDFVDLLLYNAATAKCLALMSPPLGQAILVRNVKFTQYATPAKSLTQQGARFILDFMHFNGQITLQGDCAPQLNTDTCGALRPSPAAEKNVKIRGWISGVRIITNLMGSRQFNATNSKNAKQETVFAAAEVVTNIDVRNAVALARLVRDLKRRFNISEFLHAGIGAGKDPNKPDCHSEGRAVDFVGVRMPSPAGGTDLLYINEHWGTQTTPDIADLGKTPEDATRKPRTAAWPSTSFKSLEFRLDSRTGPGFTPILRLAKSFWRGMWDMVVLEYRGNSGTQNIGEDGFIMHPDHPTSAVGQDSGREAHFGHLHFQIGDTGNELPGPAPQC